MKVTSIPRREFLRGVAASLVASDHEVSNGVPSEGFGFFAFPEHPDQYATDFRSYCTNTGWRPRQLLSFMGAFDAPGILSYNDRHAASWAANPLSSVSSKLEPILGVTTWTIDGSVTFDTAVTGANAPFWDHLIKSWTDRGYRELSVRLAYEDNFSTTPAGQGAEKAGFHGSTCVISDFRDGRFARAFRAVAHDLHTIGRNRGARIRVIWGPTHISSCPVPPTVYYPDNEAFMSDNYGPVVDIHGPDLYSNNFWGNTYTEYSGYENQPAFTLDFSPTGVELRVSHWAKNPGNKFHWFDFMDGAQNPDGTAGHGWSVWSALNFALKCPHGPKPVMWPEYGIISSWDGSGRGGLLDQNGLGYDPDLARYTRSRIQWFQSRGGTFLGGCFWHGMSDSMEATYRREFPELVGTGP